MVPPRPLRVAIQHTVLVLVLAISCKGQNAPQTPPTQHGTSRVNPRLLPPPLYFEIHIAQYMVPPRPNCVAIQHTVLVLVLAISCTGRPFSGQEHTAPLLLLLLLLNPFPSLFFLVSNTHHHHYNYYYWTLSHPFSFLSGMMMMMMFTPERHLPTSGQHGPAPSGTPPPAQPPPPQLLLLLTLSQSAPHTPPTPRGTSRARQRATPVIQNIDTG